MKKKSLIIIITILIIILLSILLFFILSPKSTRKTANNYNFSDSSKELPGTKSYTNEKLEKAHCVDNVCVENVVFYYNGNKGRVDYTIMNRNPYSVSGTLKMVFGDKSLLVSYNNLSAQSRIEGSSSYVDLDIKDKENYKLEKLSKEELKKIIKK